jgi:hypothetical protein
VRVGIFCYEYIHHIPSFLLHTHGKKQKPPPFFQKKKGEEDRIQPEKWNMTYYVSKKIPMNHACA